MGTSANPIVTASVSSSSGSGVSPTPDVPRKPRLRVHKKGNPSVTSVTFVGESYWRSKTPKLVSLEVASQTPSIIKRGFEYMYHKSHGYRLTGGSLYFRPVSSFVRKSQRDVPPRGVISTCLDSDDILSPVHVMPVPSDPRKKHGGTVAVDVYSDSTKNVLEAAPLISLEEAKQREASRKNCALEQETQVEHEVRRLKHEVAEIAWKKAQAKRGEEERLARLEEEDREKEALKTLDKQKREEGPTLTAAVAARDDGLVVAPTNWIVPLISLDEARHTEKAKRDAADKFRPPFPLPSPPPSAVASVDSLMINAGDGNAVALRLISLEEAAKRDRARRLEEDAIRSRSRMLAYAGTGLSHVPLITLVEARKQDAVRRENGSWQGGDKTELPNSRSESRKPSHLPPFSTANRAIETVNGDRHAAAHEKAHWLALTPTAGNWWTRSKTSHLSGPVITRAPMDITD